MARLKQPKVVVKKLGKEKAWGQYIQETNTIEVDERLSGKLKLEIYCHEYLHHLYKDMSEESVYRSAKYLSDFLWKHHVRFVDNKNTED